MRYGKRVNNGGFTVSLYEYDRVILEITDGVQTAVNVYGNALISRNGEFFMHNGHGDVTAIWDNAGNIVASYYYDAFGVHTNVTGSSQNPYRYAGYLFDEETGLYYLNSRYYDAETARFLSEDTYFGEAGDPLSLNLYAYCKYNPLRYVDPTGHSAVSLNTLVLPYFDPVSPSRLPINDNSEEVLAQHAVDPRELEILKATIPERVSKPTYTVEANTPASIAQAQIEALQERLSRWLEGKGTNVVNGNSYTPSGGSSTGVMFARDDTGRLAVGIGISFVNRFVRLNRPILLTAGINTNHPVTDGGGGYGYVVDPLAVIANSITFINNGGQIEMRVTNTDAYYAALLSLIIYGTADEISALFQTYYNPNTLFNPYTNYMFLIDVTSNGTSPRTALNLVEYYNTWGGNFRHAKDYGLTRDQLYDYEYAWLASCRYYAEIQYMQMIWAFSAFDVRTNLKTWQAIYGNIESWRITGVIPSIGDDMTRLYRVMDNAEYNSLMQTGKFSSIDGVMDAKWFATSSKDAAKWGQKFYPNDGGGRIIYVDVPTSSLSDFFYQAKIDSIGAGYCSEIDFLNAIMKGFGVIK